MPLTATFGAASARGFGKTVGGLGDPYDITVLMVAGGAGAGHGGGGGGGMRSSTLTIYEKGTYTVTCGSGGAGATGGPSTFPNDGDNGGVSSVAGDLLDAYIDLRSGMVADQSMSFLFISNSGQKTYPKMIYRSVNHYLSLVSSSQNKSPHILRHAFATHLLNRGADLNAIKDLLGHATLLSTQVYTQVSSQKIKKVYKQAHPRG